MDVEPHHLMVDVEANLLQTDHSVWTQVIDNPHHHIVAPNCAEPSLSNVLDSRENDRDAVWEFDYQDDSTDGPRVSLEIEVLRPIFKVLGHCLMAPASTPALKAAAVDAAKALYARSSQCLLPEAMLASRSLIRLSVGSSLGPTKSQRADKLVKSTRHGN